MVLDGLTTIFSNIWDTTKDLVILIVVILYTALFFIVQYYLVKVYIFIGKTGYKLYLMFKEKILNVEQKGTD